MEIPAVDPALPHKMQLKHFVKVVRREVEPVVTPADNVKTLTLLNRDYDALNAQLFFAPRAASCPRGFLCGRGAGGW